MRASVLKHLASASGVVLLAALVSWATPWERESPSGSSQVTRGTPRADNEAQRTEAQQGEPARLPHGHGQELSEKFREVWASLREHDVENDVTEPALTWAEISSRFDLPENKLELPELVREWLDEAHADATGATHVKLARVAEYCRSAAQSVDTLDREMERASHAVRLGEDGRAAAQARVQDLEQRYAACSRLAEMLPEIAPGELLTTAALRGNEVAAVELATSVEPPGYQDWSAEERAMYRRSMGDVLEESRANCEPTAFEAFATARGRGKLWERTGDAVSSDSVERYANMLALGLYQAQQTKGAHDLGVLQNNFKQLQLLEWTQEMTPDEVAAADAYGRALYQRYCQDT